MRYLTSKEICTELKITPTTLKRWKDTNIIHYKKITSKKYLYDVESIVKDTHKENRLNIIYSRVSNVKQKDDLLRQTSIIKEFMIKSGIKPDKVFEDITSGMNENRKGFNELLDLVFDYKINKIYVSSKDRLTRFGFEYFENIFSKFGTKIEVLNLTTESDYQIELTVDLATIIDNFSVYLDNRKELKIISNKIKEMSKGEE